VQDEMVRLEVTHEVEVEVEEVTEVLYTLSTEH